MCVACEHLLRFHVRTHGNAMHRVQSSAAEMSKQQRLMDELELRRRMKAVVVPTDDAEVRRLLRAEGEPITLFGEREVSDMERRWACSRCCDQAGLQHVRACLLDPSQLPSPHCPCSWNGPSGSAGCMQRAAGQAQPEVGGARTGGGHVCCGGPSPLPVSAGLGWAERIVPSCKQFPQRHRRGHMRHHPRPASCFTLREARSCSKPDSR